MSWCWLVDGLADAGYRVHRTNTWGAKRYEGLKYTDDRHDARWLAYLLSLGILPEGFIYPKEDRAVRDLLRRRAFLVHERISFLLSMRGAFECRTGMRVASNDIKKWTAGGVEQSIDDPLAALGITCLLGPIATLNDQIKVIEKEASRRGKLRDEFERLRTVWGIGKVLGLTIMYEAGDIGRFADVGNFASCCRCVRSDRLSNGERKGSGNSRNGNPYLSWAFSEAARFAVRHHEAARKLVHKKRSKTNTMVAVRALAHKLARASCHVMKDQVDFDPAEALG